MLDAREPRHAECLDLLLRAPGPLHVPQTVVAEVAYFISRSLDAEVESSFLQDLALGSFLPTAVDPSEWERIAELVWAYRDMPLGTTDASIVAIAERLGVTQIATLDHRHFGAVQPAHCEAFELLP